MAQDGTPRPNDGAVVPSNPQIEEAVAQVLVAQPDFGLKRVMKALAVRHAARPFPQITCFWEPTPTYTPTTGKLPDLEASGCGRGEG